MDVVTAAHDAAVQMIDTSIVRVHQHGACIADNREQLMGRSRGGLTSKIFSDTGWQDYAVLPGKQLAKVPRVEPMTHFLSVYGIAGLTAYFGLLDIAGPQSGETVVISAAAGSVGSIVGQLDRAQALDPERDHQARP